MAAAGGLLSRATQWAAPLSLPVTLLLFLQWPLRDGVGAWATQANDLAQWLFALYVAVAVAHAQQRGAHLVARPDLAALAGRWRQTGAALCVLPWALFLCLSSAPPVWRAVWALERFPESLSPGYFMVKLALLLLALLLAWQSALALRAAQRVQR